MAELEKAARAVVDSALPFGDDTPMAGHWTCMGIDALRAALEAEAGWKTVATSSDLEQGHEHRLQRRPLREDGDDA